MAKIYDLYENFQEDIKNISNFFNLDYHQKNLSNEEFIFSLLEKQNNGDKTVKDKKNILAKCVNILQQNKPAKKKTKTKTITSEIGIEEEKNIQHDENTKDLAGEINLQTNDSKQKEINTEKEKQPNEQPAIQVKNNEVKDEKKEVEGVTEDKNLDKGESHSDKILDEKKRDIEEQSKEKKVEESSRDSIENLKYEKRSDVEQKAKTAADSELETNKQFDNASIITFLEEELGECVVPRKNVKDFQIDFISPHEKILHEEESFFIHDEEKNKNGNTILCKLDILKTNLEKKITEIKNLSHNINKKSEKAKESTASQEKEIEIILQKPTQGGNSSKKNDAEKVELKDGEKEEKKSIEQRGGDKKKEKFVAEDNSAVIEKKPSVSEKRNNVSLSFEKKYYRNGKYLIDSVSLITSVFFHKNKTKNVEVEKKNHDKKNFTIDCKNDQNLLNDCYWPTQFS